MYAEELVILKDRHERALTIAGTQKLHMFKPISMNTVLVKKFSSCETAMEKKVSYTEEGIACEQIHGYITVLYDLSWWLGYTVSKDVEKKEVTVSFLHPKGPARSFSSNIQIGPQILEL